MTPEQSTIPNIPVEKPLIGGGTLMLQKTPADKGGAPVRCQLVLRGDAGTRDVIFAPDYANDITPEEYRRLYDLIRERVDFNVTMRLLYEEINKARSRLGKAG